MVQSQEELEQAYAEAVPGTPEPIRPDVIRSRSRRYGDGRVMSCLLQEHTTCMLRGRVCSSDLPC